MNLRGVIASKDKRGKSAKIAACFITFLIVGLLIYSGPAKALSLNLTGFPIGEVQKGTSVLTTASINIQSNERVNIPGVGIYVNGNLIPICYFNPFDGTTISGCDGITVNVISNSLSYGYGYGYGYGEPYGYGYNQGSSNGVLTYGITFDTTNSPVGNYTVILKTNIGGHIYSSEQREIRVIDVSSCTLNSDCDDGLSCNGLETCQSGSCQPGTLMDCSSNNLLAIATCTNNPDANANTFDFRNAFNSICDESTDSCMLPTFLEQSISHDCDITQCGAECETNSDCSDTECDTQDGCTGSDYYDYTDEANTCMGSCSCSDNSCSNPIISYSDSRCTIEEPAECSSNAECNDFSEYTEDVCLNPGTSFSVCSYQPIVCFYDSECDDNNPLIIDTCTNPGTTSSYCSHETMVCLTNAECDDADDYTQDTCEDAGLITSYCNNEPITCLADLDCDDGDESTQNTCVDAGTTYSYCSNDPLPIACFSDDECEDYDDYTQNTCVDAGLITSSCSYEPITCLTNSDCDDSNENTLDTCLDAGTTSSSCSNEIIPECYSNVDCSDNLFCNGIETCNVGSCVAGTSPTLTDGISCTADSCDETNDVILHTTQNNLCNDNLFCNGIETCSATLGCQSGTTVSCSANNILPIGSCTNTPDGNALTYDLRNAFTSTCNEASDSCTTGSSTITSTCDKTQCNAECESNSDCGTNNCGTDGCVGLNYYDYADVSNICSSCSCTSGTCASPTITTNDTRCAVIECNTNVQCNDNNAYTQDTCNNAGTITSSCTHETITCLTNSDCNDNNVNTNDLCNNPGTISSSCSNEIIPVIICSTNAQCSDNNASTQDICNNPGLITSSCTYTTIPIICYVNSGCNDNNASTSDLCNNPGTTSSSCSYTTIPVICYANSGCNDNNVNTQDACLNAGTTSSLCSNTMIPIVCSSDAQCSDNDVNTEDICNNPRTINSNCAHITIPIVCSSNAQCNDNDVNTEDACLNAGTTSSLCSNIIISECTIDADCNDGAFCNGAEKCISGNCQAGTAISCNANNILEINTCTNDNNPLTLEFRNAFTSTCNEASDSCNLGSTIIASSCDQTCGAECSMNADCNDNNIGTRDTCNSCLCEHVNIEEVQQYATAPIVVMENDTEEIIFDSESSNVLTIEVPSTIPETQEVKLNLQNIVKNDQTVISQPLLLVRQSTETINNYEAEISAGTTITGSSGWDGKVTIPTIKPSENYNIPSGNIEVVIDLGSDVKLSFNKPVKVVIGGQAGKKAAWSRGNSTLIEITTVCNSEIDPTNIDPVTVEECYINSGSDLIVWTYHFTTFVSYTPIPIVCSTNAECNDNNSSTNDICNNAGTSSSSCSNTIIPQCTNDTQCSDGIFCNGQERCSAGTCVSGTTVSCSGNNLPLISGCNGDSNPLTFDLRNAFTSVCNENTDSCTLPTYSELVITHTCDKTQCGAQCVKSSECNDNNPYTTDVCSLCKCKNIPIKNAAKNCTDNGMRWHYTVFDRDSIYKAGQPETISSSLASNQGKCSNVIYQCYYQGILYDVNTRFNVNGHWYTCGKSGRLVADGEKADFNYTWYKFGYGLKTDGQAYDGGIYDGDSGLFRCAMARGDCAVDDNGTDCTNKGITKANYKYYNSLAIFGQDRCCGDDSGEVCD